MLLKRILAVITVILVVVAIVLVNKKAKNQMPKAKANTTLKGK